MGMDKIVSLLPLAVAVIGGLFVLIASTTAKEKEIKLNKYENLGFATFGLLESCGLYISKLYSEIFNIIKDGGPISIAEVHGIVRELKEQHPDITLCRELSVKLAYADKKTSLCFNEYLGEFTSLYDQVVNFTHVTNLDNYQIKEEHTNKEAREIAEKLKVFIEKTTKKKTFITQRLSKKYNLTLNYSRNLTYCFILIFATFLLACLLTNTPQINKPQTIAKEEVITPAPAQ